MGLETPVYISDLVATNPTSSDPRNQGDDHLRNIKTTNLSLSRRVLHRFNDVTGTTVSPTAGYINRCTNVAAVASTMPASPTDGDIFGWIFTNGLSTNTINPNGKTIAGQSGTMTLNTSLSGLLLTLTYDATNSNYVLS